MSFNFNFGGMPNMDFSSQDYGFDQGIGQFGQEAMDKRQQANEARNSASNQYEADVADFRDREATEAEDTLNNIINQGGIGGLQNWNWEGEPGFTPNTQQYGGITNNASQGRSSYDPVDNWGEPGFEAYIPESEIIDPIQDFTPAEVSPFVDTNPFNDIWEAPVAEVTDNVGAGAGGDPRTDFVPVNNPFEPVVEVDYPGLGVLDPVDPIVDIPGFGDVDDPGPIPTVDIPPYIPPYTPPPPPVYGADDGSGGGYEEENGGGYGNGEENGGTPPPPPPPPPPPWGPTAGPMNRLIAMQSGMFGGSPAGPYRPYEEPSGTTYLNQPAPFPVMHGNRGGVVQANQGQYINQQPTRNLKKLFNNPLDKGLGQLPVMGQNDTLTQTVQAGFRPRR